MSVGTSRGRAPLGIAIIGNGLMAKAHTLAWRNLSTVYSDVPFEPRFIVLADATEDLARAGAGALGYERFTASWEEAVNDAQVDVVDIVTPNWLHKDPAVAAARAGRHIWCEKPLALTADDALAMTAAAEQAHIQTIVGFTYLHNPAVALAKGLVDSGAIGRPVSFTGTFAIDAMTDPAMPFTWRQDRALAGSGALGDLGAHVIALARHLVGPVASVAALMGTFVEKRPVADSALGYGGTPARSAAMRTVENDDTAMLLLSFEGGAIGTIEAHRSAAGRSFDLGFTITGTQGAIRFDQQRITELQVRLATDPADQPGFRHVQVAPGHGHYGNLWPIPGINLGIHELKYAEANALVRAIADGSTAKPDFREAWEVEKVIDAADEAAAKRTWVEVA